MSITRSPRARQVGDAAITVLASQGTRGLTHRAVDAAGQLPPGSTSNYARTRIALLTLALARIAELDTAEGMEAVGGYPESVPALTEALTLALHRMLTDEAARRRLLARFELAFEATRRPELRAVYDEMGRGFREHVARLLAAAGAGDPDRGAWTLIAWMEGTAFYALAGAGRTAIPTTGELRLQLGQLIAGICRA